MLKSKQGKVFIIAEAGVNHNGDMKIAQQLVRAAKKAGADAVKFQTFKAEALASCFAKNVGYQQKTVGKGAQVDMLKVLELDQTMHQELIKACQKEGIIFLSTAFDHQSVDLLEKLKVPAYKIPSGEITNFPLLEYIASKKKPIILSTGMSTMKEIGFAVEVLRSAKIRDLSLLHCVTEYPAPYDQLNLRAMITMEKAFKVPVGFSDHTLGIWMPIAAVALGASIIEKHLTMDQSMLGPDHKASLDPNEFKELVKAIRSTETALGDGIKRPANCEKKYILEVRKSLVATRNICKGQKILAEDITIKRPGTGISPSNLKELIGSVVQKSISKDQVLTWEMFK